MTLNTELLFNKNPAAGGYTIERSLRFNSSDSAFCSRVAVTPTDATKFTLSFWIKRSKLGAEQAIMYAGVDAANKLDMIRFTNGDAIELRQRRSNVDYTTTTTAVFRDASAWYHIVYSWSSGTRTLYVNGVSQAFASNSTTTSTHYWQSAGVTQYLGRDNNEGGSPFAYGDFYLADVHFIDGQALDPTSFGEFDTNGVWQPIEYTGSYGTNGFHLDFSDNSAATATTLGADRSGLGNNWVPNNLQGSQVGLYSSTVTLTGTASAAYPPANGFDGNSATAVYVDGTLYWNAAPYNITVNNSLVIGQYAGGSNTSYTIKVNGTTVLTQFVPAGAFGITQNVNLAASLSKPFVLNSLEIIGGTASINTLSVDGAVLIDSTPASIDSLRDSPTNGDAANDTGLGGQVPGNYATWNPLASGATLANGNLDVSGSTAARGTIGVTSGKWYYEFTLSTNVGANPNLNVGVIRTNATSSSFTYDLGNSLGASSGDVIGVALDVDAGRVWIAKNGTWVGSGNPAGNTNPTISSITLNNDSLTFFNGPFNSVSYSANFGSRPFAYTAPSGFKALCTANLPTPTIADGSTAMDVALWTGNGGTQTISGLGFESDLIAIKCRNNGTSFIWQDSVRGISNKLGSNGTWQENESNNLGAGDGYVSGTSSTGFTVTNGSQTNENARTYAAWAWDAGSSTVTNTSGSISSQVRAAPDKGFSIVSFTPASSGAFTVGHGLNATPSLVIAKARNRSVSWFVYSNSLSSPLGKFLELNSGAAVDSNYANFWGTTAFSSTVFGMNTGVSCLSTDNMIAYCFAPVAGYSAFGSYTGNGNTTGDGAFVYLGFRPRWIMIKGTGTDSWIIHDAARNTYNFVGNRLWANLSDQEASSTVFGIDMLSNGFKTRVNNADQGGWNASGQTYIYCAFAEHPFQTARAR